MICIAIVTECKNYGNLYLEKGFCTLCKSEVLSILLGINFTVIELHSIKDNTIIESAVLKIHISYEYK